MQSASYVHKPLVCHCRVEVKAESALKQDPPKHSPVKSPPKHSPEIVEVVDLTAEDDNELHPLTQLSERESQPMGEDNVSFTQSLEAEMKRYQPLLQPPTPAKAPVSDNLRPITSPFPVAPRPRAKKHKQARVLCDACDSPIPKASSSEVCSPLNVFVVLVYST